MINFDAAKQRVIERLNITNDIVIIDTIQKNILKYDSDDTCIAISTEYMDENGIGQQIIFHLKLPKYFPLVPPKIFIPSEDHKRVALLPHIENTGLVCTFDPEVTRTDPDNPIGIVNEFIKKAKLIIEEGLSGVNIRDYETEFESYWNREYGPKDKIYNRVLNICDAPFNNAKLRLLQLNKATRGYKYIIHQDEEHSARFINYLNLNEITYDERSIFYAGEVSIDFRPPFNLKNRNVFEIISRTSLEVQQNFKRYLNDDSSSKMVVATVTTLGNQRVIGWKHSYINTNRNGFRKGVLTKYEVLKTFQVNSPVERFLPVRYSPKQKELRTVGVAKNQKPFVFLIAGLGSIGSNLVHFLNSFNEAEFRLIDYDVLKMENLGRHFLGYSFTSLNKAIAMKQYLLNKNPFQNVDVKEESILSVWQQDESYLNNADYLFMTTGDNNAEKFIAWLQKEKKIIKPIFFIWVEPYLIGGHCLFLHPDSSTYDQFFSQDNFFTNNVINNDEYRLNKPILTIKHAGCQTTFTPYAQSTISLFLSSIFIEINKIIANKVAKSIAFSWVGDLKFATESGLKINEIYSSISNGEVVAYDL